MVTLATKACVGTRSKMPIGQKNNRTTIILTSLQSLLSSLSFNVGESKFWWYDYSLGQSLPVPTQASIVNVTNQHPIPIPISSYNGFHHLQEFITKLVVKKMKKYSNEFNVLGFDTTKGSSHRLGKSHEVWMMMMMISALIMLQVECGQEQWKSVSSSKWH